MVSASGSSMSPFPLTIVQDGYDIASSLSVRSTIYVPLPTPLPIHHVSVATPHETHTVSTFAPYKTHTATSTRHSTGSKPFTAGCHSLTEEEHPPLDKVPCTHHRSLTLPSMCLLPPQSRTTTWRPTLRTRKC
ncbi:hypothetical protein VNO78_11732 [Psophocarpus tetragonolobus]|uniref:Uncharacterized protein n=1 Tax=Psophocarpus tetragonolobus TaxID=3891 RepID=A0AAN9XNG9_PSOTE